METDLTPDTTPDTSPMPTFLFCVITVKDEAPNDYRVTRMRNYLAYHGETDVDINSARFGMMVAPTALPLLVPRAEHPSLSQAAQHQHAARTACALQAVENETPLLPGEVVEQDEFTLLAVPFNGCPERTPVLRRVTNYGELLYVFTGTLVNPTGRLVFPKPKALRKAPTPRNVASVGASVGAFIAKGIASGMLSAVGGAISKGLMDQLFPPGVPNYFDEVYAEIKRIMGGELQQAAIDQVNGAINNIKLHISTEYKPAKQSRDLTRTEDRQFLFNLLQKYETTYLSGPGGMLGTLMADNYAKLGFGVFLIGAGLHLALYQEMANVDPNNKDHTGQFRSPLLSSYGLPNTGTVAATARHYAAFAEITWPQVVAHRMAKITENGKTLCSWGDTTGGSCRYFVWYRDALNLGNMYLPGQVPNDANRVIKVVEAVYSKDKSNSKSEALKRECEAYRVQKAQELTSLLQNPVEIAADWRQLITSPIKVA